MQAAVASAKQEHVNALQRARLLAATVEVACGQGAPRLSVSDVVTHAGVSRRTFYELFADIEDCCLAAFAHGLALLEARVGAAGGWDGSARNGSGAAGGANGSWRASMRAALAATLAFCDEQPLLARFLIIESDGVGAGVAERRAAVFARLVDAIDGGRQKAGSAMAPALTAEALAGGVLAVLQSRLRDPDGAPLVELTNPLMYTIVLPYLGAAAARRELECAVPSFVARPSADALPRLDPFREANMRLTYRTIRVLSAVAEHPGASNRTIGDAASVRDQGQISKLLARLERTGMIANARTGAGRGGANCWTLTDSGRQAVESVRGNGLER
jgi:AcrR family transcriptional regulator